MASGPWRHPHPGRSGSCRHRGDRWFAPPLVRAL